MKFSIGTDIEKTERFVLPQNEKLISLLFSKREIKQCKKKKEAHIAFTGKFCAKEAVLKAFAGDISITDIEIINTFNGKPEVYILGKKRNDIQCSISHIEDIAMATAILIT